MLFGGAAGGGKSDSIIHDALPHMNHPLGRALILRESYPSLSELMDRTQGEFRQLGAEWRASEKLWKFPSGGIFQFGFCSDWQDAQSYIGKELTYIGYDEIGGLREERVWALLLTRLRSKSPDLKVYARATANPGGAGHGWIKARFITPTDGGKKTYVDPITGLTRAYIPSRVTDNPIMLANNPTYLAQLQALPDRMRRQLLDGDWDAGAGLAFEDPFEMVPPFVPPSHWQRFGGYDYGYRHPWWFISLVVNEDGDVYVTHAVKGRLDLPEDIANKVEDALDADMPRHAQIAGGLDLWHQLKSRGETGPTLAETFYLRKWPLVRATVSRRSGYQNLLQYLNTARGTKPPRLKFFDTPGVRSLVAHLKTITIDEDNPEDTLKMDADPDTGNGGDDGYDALRYAMMLRPYTAPSTPYRSPFAGHQSNVSDSRDSRALEVPSLSESEDVAGQSLGGEF